MVTHRFFLFFGLGFGLADAGIRLVLSTGGSVRPASASRSSLGSSKLSLAFTSDTTFALGVPLASFGLDFDFFAGVSGTTVIDGADSELSGTSSTSAKSGKESDTCWSTSFCFISIKRS